MEKKSNIMVAWGWSWKKRGRDGKGALRKIWGTRETFFILLVMMISPVYKDVKFDQTVIKYLQFVVLQLYLNKNAKKYVTLLPDIYKTQTQSQIKSCQYILTFKRFHLAYSTSKWLLAF